MNINKRNGEQLPFGAEKRDDLRKFVIGELRAVTRELEVDPHELLSTVEATSGPDALQEILEQIPEDDEHLDTESQSGVNAANALEVKRKRETLKLLRAICHSSPPSETMKFPQFCALLKNAANYTLESRMTLLNRACEDAQRELLKKLRRQIPKTPDEQKMCVVLFAQAMNDFYSEELSS